MTSLFQKLLSNTIRSKTRRSLMVFTIISKFVLGQQRSRMLATLFKDERCQQLPAYGILEKMYASTNKKWDLTHSLTLNNQLSKSKQYAKVCTLCGLCDNELKFHELTLQFWVKHYTVLHCTGYSHSVVKGNFRFCSIYGAPWEYLSTRSPHLARL